MALREDGNRFSLLVDVANDESQSDAIRAEALVGLSAAAAAQQSLIERFADGDNRVLKQEARRLLRLMGQLPPVSEEKPAARDLAAWREQLRQPGDADLGRRLFFSPVGPQCGVCHRHHGRGGSVGPDLTNVAQQSSRERTITSILDPKRGDRPPLSAVAAADRRRQDTRRPATSQTGRRRQRVVRRHGPALLSSCRANRSSTVSQRPASIMPSGLEKSLTVADLRDLLTFLTSEQ